MGSDDQGKATSNIIDIIRTNDCSPPGHAVGWRRSRTSAIVDRSRQAGDEFAYVAYTLRAFGKTELAALTDHELERTWRHVIRRRGR